MRIKQDLPYKSKQKNPETNLGGGVRITNEGKMNYWRPVTWIRWDVASIYIFVVVYFHGVNAVKQREEGDKKKKDT